MAGIGRAVALKLAALGAKVVGLSRTQSDLDSLKAEVTMAIKQYRSIISPDPEYLESSSFLRISVFAKYLVQYPDFLYLLTANSGLY